MTILISSVVGTVADFTRWAKTAQPGDWRTYHAGELALDRKKDRALTALADTVLVLVETGFVLAQQRRTWLFVEDVWLYTVTRTGRGYAPAAIIDRKLTSFEWRALKALRDRDADISATRAIRDALAFVTAPTDASAQEMLAELARRNMVRESEARGWELTPKGLGALT